MSLNFENRSDKSCEALLFHSVVSPDPDFDSVAFKKVGPGEDEAEGAAGGEESLADDSSPPPPYLCF